MINSDYRIPDEMAGEILAEAARLYAQASKGYSLADLQQACSEANIPAHIISQAIQNVESKRANKRIQQQQLRNYINQQVKKGISIGIIILIPALAISSIFIFRKQFQPIVAGIVYKINPNGQEANSPFKILKVQEGKLEYLNDPRGLSIAVRSINYYSARGVTAIISTDGYPSFTLESAKVGDTFEYKGIYNYSIKVIEVNSNSVTFQIEQLSNKNQSAQYRFEEKIKQVEQESEALKAQLKEMKNTEDTNKLTIKWKEEEVDRLRQENSRLQQENYNLKWQVNTNKKTGL